MLKRIFAVWLAANFLIIGIVCWLAGGWYLGWPSPLAATLAELGLIMLPNFLLSILVLRYGWPEPAGSIREALGWRWQGWRSVLVGIVAFILIFALVMVVTSLVGDSIPYELPGREGFSAQSLTGVLGVLLLILLMVAVTVAGEETLFRGLIQTQVGAKYGPGLGLLAGALLFGLRHLPADLFYAQVCGASPRMWISRQMQLYGGALIFGLARYYGRSTYAPAIAHALFFLVMLFI